MRALRSLLAAVAAACSCFSAAHAQVAVGTMRTNCSAFVVLDNGDVYRSDILNCNMSFGSSQTPWVLHCNVFSAGGPPSRVVGLSGESILTADGGIYRIGDPGQAVFDGAAPAPPGEWFVAFGGRVAPGTGPCWVFAVTNTGGIYRTCVAGQWEFAGTLPIGPVPSPMKSWGELKLKYR